MTSDEIKNANNLDSQYFWIWLKECAYQLAVMNERNQLSDKPPFASRAGSKSALRGKGPQA